MSDGGRASGGQATGGTHLDGGGAAGDGAIGGSEVGGTDAGGAGGTEATAGTGGIHHVPLTGGNGGTAGSAPVATGGAGGGLPACDGPSGSVRVEGCLLDAAGTRVLTALSAAVSVVSVGKREASGCGVNTSLTTELRLRAADSREWSYFVTMPDLPADQVVVGDQLDLSVTSNGRPFPDQTVALGQGGALVLFSVVSWLSRAPDLSAYSLGLTVGEPICAGAASIICGGSGTLFYPLLVTRGADSAQLQSGETKLVGDLSVSVQALSAILGSTCDPGASFQYGGFSLRR